MADRRAASPFLIAFCDLTRFMAQSQRVTDVEMADTLDEFYRQVAAGVAAGGGRVLKYMGDAAFVVFPEKDVDRGVAALLALKEDVDRLMQARGWDCQLAIKVHFGEAVAGPFGATGAEHFDVLGKAVNTAATLPGRGGVSLSVPAFRQLGPELRRRFKKHTPPVTYIRVEDSHRAAG